MPSHEPHPTAARRPLSGSRLRIIAYLVAIGVAGHALLDVGSLRFDVFLGLMLATSLLHQASTADRLDRLERLEHARDQSAS